MPGRLLARTTCFPTALGAVGEDFDTGRGAVEQMLARGGPAPPLCLSPFFSSLSSALLPAYFPFRLCPFTSSLRLLSVCFPRRFCRPVFLSSPLSALLSVFLSTFACPSFTFPPSAPTVLSALCRHTQPLSARFFFSPLSLTAFYAFCPSVFPPTSPCPLLLSTSVARRFLCVLAVYLFVGFSPPVFSFASRRLAFSPLSSALLSLCRRLSACFFFLLSSAVLYILPIRLSPPVFPLCLFGLSAPAIHRSLRLFPSSLSDQFSSLPLPPAYFSPPSLRPSFSPPFVNLSFPLPLPPALLSIRLPSVRPPGEKGGRPLDI